MDVGGQLIGRSFPSFTQYRVGTECPPYLSFGGQFIRAHAVQT